MGQSEVIRSPSDHGRGSWQLNDGEVEKAREAAAEACDGGIPFNRMITILWGHFGVEDIQAATRCFLKSVKDYLRRSGYETAYVWAMEPGRRMGLHVHILIHVPPEMGREIGYRQRGWLKTAGVKFGKNLIRSKVIGGRAGLYRGSPEAQTQFATEHDRALAYILKHCSFEARNTLRFPCPCRSGWVPGRRFGRSRPKLALSATEMVDRRGRAICNDRPDCRPDHASVAPDT